MDASPTPRFDADRTIRWPVVIASLAVTAILAIAVSLVLEARSQVELRTRQTSWNLLHAIQRDVGRNFEVLNLSLQAVVDGLASPEVMSLSPVLRNQVLFDRSASARGVGALIVFDRDGVLRIDSTSPEPHWIQPVVDRDYFQAQREPGRGLFVSRPYLSRLIGKDVIGLSRRLSGPNGEFAGVALATIQLTYFQELIDRLHLAPGEVVTLFREDGAVLLRSGTSGLEKGGDVSKGTVFAALQTYGSGDYVGRSTIDGIERLYSFSRIDGLPLFLTIGVPVVSVYDEWTKKSALVLGVLAVVSAILVALTFLLARQLQGRAAAEHQLRQANLELERLSTTDALTGLGNRRLYDDSLARHAREAARDGGKLSLVLLDVDRFKLFNDIYGHPEGDRALQQVGTLLGERAAAAGAMAFRIGGEEFALLMPGTNLSGAFETMRALERALASLGLRHSESATGALTVSQGATEIVDGDIAAAVERADRALYRAKRDGRGRACLQPCYRAA